MSEQRKAALDEVERNNLSAVVTGLRTAIEADLRQTLEGTYGIRRTGDPEAEDRLALDPKQHATRQELLGLWHALGGRTDLLVRESAFTHANRLIAIRVAEALGLLPESIAKGRRSAGFRQVLEVAPLLGSDDDAGYWTYLQICGDELAHDIPHLFDPRNPLLALRPAPAAIDALIAPLTPDALGAAHPDGPAWAAPDTLGWAYQFFNSDQERAEMRKAHPQPQDSRELAVRNQFFTPDYVVRFLGHNTLGRRLVEGGIAELADTLELLVDPPAAAGEAIDLANVRVLDPACGSGHFLLGAYDILERAWQLRGVDPAAAASAIVGSLWGIDIDPRAVQVASAAVMFRARRHLLDGQLPPPNIVCARAFPGGTAARMELFQSVGLIERSLLIDLVSQLDRAPQLGSLLRVEALVEAESSRRRRRVEGGSGESSSLGGRAAAQGRLYDGFEPELLGIEAVVETAQRAADTVTSSPEERVLAANGGDALRLVEVLTQRYDAVLMNPPFGEPIPATKKYLHDAYPWHPTKDFNLLALFVGRGLELCKPDGYLGAITSRAGMFLTTFERWREQVLLRNDLTVLADLGHKVMHDALVEAAAYVVRPGSARHDRPATFIRLTREAPARRPAALAETCKHVRSRITDERVFSVAPAAFAAIPGSPMAYWMGPGIRRLFTEFPPLEGHGAEVRQGLATGDDFRFVRAFWEVDPARIARSREETFEGKRWVPFAKGGEYSPFWADIHLVVDFERDGERLRNFPGARPQNLQYSFRPGLTWPRRTASAFGVRALPTGCAFADKGPVALAKRDTTAMLGWLNSRVAEACVVVQLGAADETSGGGASKSYEVGTIAKVPWPAKLVAGPGIEKRVERILELLRALDHEDETTRAFVACRVPSSSLDIMTLDRAAYHDAAAVEVIAASLAVEEQLIDAIGDPQMFRTLDEELGLHPGRLPHGAPPSERAEPLLGLSLDALLKTAVDIVGPQRSVTQKTYVADRRLEVLATVLGAHPAEVAAVRKSSGIIGPDERAAVGEDVVSYLVGCAFGRWDVRIGRDPSLAPPVDPDPFAPVPVCPPGMLVGPDGLPGVPDRYPLALTDHRVLVDEPGHRADLGQLVQDAAAILVDDPASLLAEAAQLLGVADARTYLRRRFFKDHLSRYSKSRRKAPLYWPLTVPSRRFTVWLYAPALSREAIFAAAAHAKRRHDAAEAESRRLESAQLQASTADPGSLRSITRQLDATRSLAEELRTFHRSIAHVADTGWVPDLDDGIVVCAAPFADLLPDWPKDPAETLVQLRTGKLDWTSAHRWRGAL